MRRPPSQGVRPPAVSFRPCFHRTATKTPAAYLSSLAEFRWGRSGCLGGTAEGQCLSGHGRWGALVLAPSEDVADQRRLGGQYRPGQALCRTLVRERRSTRSCACARPWRGWWTRHRWSRSNRCPACRRHLSRCHRLGRLAEPGARNQGGQGSAGAAQAAARRGQPLLKDLGEI